jgi:hypothetical protein
MSRNSRLKAVLVPVAALAVVFTLACHRAEAQVKPFKVVGAGLIPDGIPTTPLDPRPHWAVGVATELGRYFNEGVVQLLRFTSATTADFDSAEPCVFTAADGSELAFTYGDVSNGAQQPGEVTLYPQDDGTFVAVWVAEFNPIPELCTGRFANVVDGSFIMVAVTEPFVLGSTDPVGYEWEGKGWIEFGK